MTAKSERHVYAATIRWAHQDPREHAEKIRSAQRERYLRLADPDGELSEPERLRRAQKLLDAHAAKMRLAKARKHADARKVDDELNEAVGT